MQARAIQRVRSALADMDGLALVSACHGCSLSALLPKSREYAVQPYTQHADIIAWHQRRQSARPKQLSPSKANPYSKYAEPKPWPVIHAKFMEHAVRNRPVHRNRMRWDRQVQRQLQIMKNAWTRQYNCWRNQEMRREDAEARWQTRRQMQECEATGKYLFAEEYEQKVQKMLAAAAYRPFNRVRKAAQAEEARDSLLEGVDDFEVAGTAGTQQEADSDGRKDGEQTSEEELRQEIKRLAAERSKREL